MSPHPHTPTTSHAQAPQGGFPRGGGAGGGGVPAGGAVQGGGGAGVEAVAEGVWVGVGVGVVVMETAVGDQLLDDGGLAAADAPEEDGTWVAGGSFATQYL